MRAAERAGPAAIAFVVAGVSAVIALGEWALGVASAETIATIGASAVANIVGVYSLDRVRRDNALVAELTLVYLSTGDRNLLDDVLGRLIRGEFRRRDLRPSNELFHTLEKIVASADWELKRRIVEAAPGLAEIDDQRTIMLLRELRSDWEGTEWKGDLRRRSIEALIVPGPTTGERLLGRAAAPDLRAMIMLRDDDEVWTGFPAVEASVRLAVIHSDDRAELANDARAQLEYGLQRLRISDDERTLLREYGVAYEQVARDNLSEPLDWIGARKNATSALVRAAAARLTGWVAAHPDAVLYSQRILELMSQFSTDDDRNVRRPMAREVAVRFLLLQLTKAGDEVARSILFERLLQDDDPIIPTTTFDLIAGERMDGEHLRQAIDAVEAKGSEDLKHRAERAKQQLAFRIQ